MVLREVGMLLRSSARTVDFVGRYGGEEFVIVLPETWSDDAVVMAERTRRLVHGHRFTLPTGEAIRLSISIGIAGLPEHANDLPTLLESADRALYAAKASGRNRVVLFEPEADRVLNTL
jgi:diguanylate cyclase